MLTDTIKGPYLLGAAAIVLAALGYLTLSPKPQVAESPEQASVTSGQLLVERNGCRGCHQPGNMFRAPELEGLYGIERELDDGSKVVADDSYLSESIWEPLAKVVKGYPANMPAYKGQITDLEMQDILAYLKAIKSEP